MARDVKIFLWGKIPSEGKWKGWALKITNFLGPEIATSEFFRDHPFQCPSNWFAPIKIIKSKHHIKMGTLVILCTWIFCSCILYSVFCILYSVFYTVFCEFYFIFRALTSNGTKWIHLVQNNLKSTAIWIVRKIHNNFYALRCYRCSTRTIYKDFCLPPPPPKETALAVGRW